MADLISQANRLNDVEINNNAPVSSQTQRRIGSDINYLLDYLGITNGATLGGPTTGINVFTPAQSISFSRAFVAADINTAVTLFTYTGGGDRPLKFFKRDSGFAQTEFFVENNITQISPTVNSEIIFSNKNPSAICPIQSILYRLRLSTGFQRTVFTVKVNGITMGALTRSGSQTTGEGDITLNRSLTFSPSGTNTFTVTPTYLSGGSLTTTVTIADSFEYVAL